MAAGRRRSRRRSPAATSRRSSSRARSRATRASCRSAADARARRRRDRVRPPPARRRARRGPRDPARLLRARGGPVALRPDPRPLRGPIVGEYRADVSEEELGIAMTGGSGGARRERETPVAPASRHEHASAAGTRRALGGVLVPPRGDCARVPHRRPRRRVTGHNPFSTYKAIFEGTGLNWFFPWVQGDERSAPRTTFSRRLSSRRRLS